jgi:predicted SnoaL-like aldol condensation-catalyzing enzyme
MAVQKSGYAESQDNPEVDLVVEYIHRVWNGNNLSELSVYLHDDYIDHSMPHTSVQNKDGLLLYLRELALTVSHTTEIVGLTTLGELIICHIRISVNARCMTDVVSRSGEIFYGYRTFRMYKGKIAEHWEIL